MRISRAIAAVFTLILVGVVPCFGRNEANPAGYTFYQDQAEIRPARLVEGVYVVNPAEQHESLFIPTDSLLSAAGQLWHSDAFACFAAGANHAFSRAGFRSVKRESSFRKWEIADSLLKPDSRISCWGLPVVLEYDREDRSAAVSDGLRDFYAGDEDIGPQLPLGIPVRASNQVLGGAPKEHSREAEHASRYGQD